MPQVHDAVRGDQPIPAAAFLDLQGTLGGDGFGDIRDFAFFPWAIPAIRTLNEAGLCVIIVTNQSRIGRGLFTMADFSARIGALQCEVEAAGARIDGVYCCPHTKEECCLCRKPSPVLLQRARRDLGLDLSASYVVGDSGAWDMLMARAAGCRAVLVRTGLGEGSLGPFRHLWAEMEPNYIARDVLDAAAWIVTRDHVMPGNWP
jgi:D-glycero-D-manno-heptose 1,7-bisphosphate phosphatase